MPADRGVHDRGGHGRTRRRRRWVGGAENREETERLRQRKAAAPLAPARPLFRERLHNGRQSRRDRAAIGARPEGSRAAFGSGSKSKAAAAERRCFAPARPCLRLKAPASVASLYASSRDSCRCDPPGYGAGTGRTRGGHGVFGRGGGEAAGRGAEGRENRGGAGGAGPRHQIHVAGREDGREGPRGHSALRADGHGGAAAGSLSPAGSTSRSALRVCECRRVRVFGEGVSARDVDVVERHVLADGAHGADLPVVVLRSGKTGAEREKG